MTRVSGFVSFIQSLLFVRMVSQSVNLFKGDPIEGGNYGGVKINFSHAHLSSICMLLWEGLVSVSSSCSIQDTAELKGSIYNNDL